MLNQNTQSGDTDSLNVNDVELKLDQLTLVEEKTADNNFSVPELRTKVLAAWDKWCDHPVNLNLRVAIDNKYPLKRIFKLFFANKEDAKHYGDLLAANLIDDDLCILQEESAKFFLKTIGFEDEEKIFSALIAQFDQQLAKITADVIKSNCSDIEDITYSSKDNVFYFNFKTQALADDFQKQFKLKTDFDIFSLTNTVRFIKLFNGMEKIQANWQIINQLLKLTNADNQYLKLGILDVNVENNEVKENGNTKVERVIKIKFADEKDLQDETETNIYKEHMRIKQGKESDIVFFVSEKAAIILDLNFPLLLSLVNQPTHVAAKEAKLDANSRFADSSSKPNFFEKRKTEERATQNKVSDRSIVKKKQKR